MNPDIEEPSPAPDPSAPHDPLTRELLSMLLDEPLPGSAYDPAAVREVILRTALQMIEFHQRGSETLTAALEEHIDLFAASAAIQDIRSGRFPKSA